MKKCYKKWKKLTQRYPLKTDSNWYLWNKQDMIFAHASQF